MGLGGSCPGIWKTLALIALFHENQRLGAGWWGGALDRNSPVQGQEGLGRSLCGIGMD